MQKFFIFGIIFISTLAAGLEAYLEVSGYKITRLIHYGSMLPSLALIFFWVRFDSAKRGFKTGRLFDVMLLALAIVTVPYYLYRSRSPRERVKSFFWLIIFFIAMILANIGAVYAVYYFVPQLYPA